MEIVGGVFRLKGEVDWWSGGDYSMSCLRQATTALTMVCGCLKTPISVDDINKSFIEVGSTNFKYIIMWAIAF